MKKVTDWSADYHLDPIECSMCKKLFGFIIESDIDNLYYCMTCYNTRWGWEKTKFEIDWMNKNESYHVILWEKPISEVPKEILDKLPLLKRGY